MADKAANSRSWNRSVNILSLCLWIFDYSTDVYTVTVYWAEQPFSTAVLATIVAAISGLISLVLVPGLIYLVWTGKEYGVKWTCYLKYGIATYGSTPQLCINLYVLSTCGQVVHPIQYVSAIASFAEICSGIACGEQAFCDQSSEERTWSDRGSLFAAKIMVCSARILISVIYIIYEGWWSLLIVLAHALILFPCGVLKAKKEWKRNEIFVNFLTLFKLIFFGVGFIFVWFGDTVDKQSTIAWTTLYYFQSIAMVVPTYARIYSHPTCLVFGIFFVVLGLLKLCIIFAALNIVIAGRHRKILKYAYAVKGDSAV